jgi:hypothetical protein
MGIQLTEQAELSRSQPSKGGQAAQAAGSTQHISRLVNIIKLDNKL